MMRTLLILVCTINVLMTGCRTSTKKPACGTACVQTACAQTACGSAPQIGLATVQAEPDPEPEEKPIVETSHSKQIENPFEKIIEEPKPKISVPNYARGENYAWLIGELQRVHSPGHEWKLRYAPLDEHDEWGGSVILGPDARLDEWNDGDRVYVEGEILAARPSLYLSGPLYRVRAIRPAADVPQIIPRIAQELE